MAMEQYLVTIKRNKQSEKATTKQTDTERNTNIQRKNNKYNFHNETLENNVKYTKLE